MEFRFTPQGNLIEKVIFSLKRAGDNSTYPYTAQELVADELNSVYVDFNTLFDVENDHAIYPITLETIKFSINSSKAEKQEYRIPIEGIYLHYAGLPDQPSHVENILQEETANKVLHNGQLIIIKNNKTYNILGHEITENY
jgi:hypothetical protein